jgi:hypothetical protein
VNSRFWRTALLAPERLARGRFDDVLKRALRPVLVAKQDLPTLISNDQPSPHRTLLYHDMPWHHEHYEEDDKKHITDAEHNVPHILLRVPRRSSSLYIPMSEIQLIKQFHTSTISKCCQDKVTTSGMRFWWGRRLPLSANAK